MLSLLPRTYNGLSKASDEYKNCQNPPLQVKTPATGKIHEIARIPPNCAPDSNVDEQIHTVLLKIETFLGKTQNCRWQSKTQWKAIKSVLEPGLLYPLMATLYTNEDIKILER